ncbi:MAG: hypothetical protein Q9221_002131 [Calogaya cf. arnoldii]
MLDICDTEGSYNQGQTNVVAPSSDSSDYEGNNLYIADVESAGSALASSSAVGASVVVRRSSAVRGAASTTTRTAADLSSRKLKEMPSPESSSPASFENVRGKRVPELCRPSRSSPEVREKHKWRAEIKAQKAESTEDIETPSSIPSFYQEQARAPYNTHSHGARLCAALGMLTVLD